MKGALAGLRLPELLIASLLRSGEGKGRLELESSPDDVNGRRKPLVRQLSRPYVEGAGVKFPPQPFWGSNLPFALLAPTALVTPPRW